MASGKTRSPSPRLAKLTKVRAAASAKLARDRARAEALLALVARRKQRIVEDFYDIGEALRELLRKELYRALGHRSFEEMLRARGVMSAEQARKLVAVVEHVPREQALTLGQEKAYALVAYTAATPEPDVPAELVKADARVGGKPLSKASRRDIEAAAREVRARERAKKPRSEADARRARLERTALAELRRRLAASKLRAASIVVRGSRVVVELDLDALARLAG
jgi:hypothetical protein